ncbi:MAG: hypothetical protein SGILL_003800, partial [Bacillariaceae sp.]
MEEPFFDEDAFLEDYMDFEQEEEPDAEAEYEMMMQSQAQSQSAGNNGNNTTSTVSVSDGHETTTAAAIAVDDNAMDVVPVTGNNDGTTVNTSNSSSSTTQQVITPEKPEEENETMDKDPHASVEEYLAARKQENQLFSFQRYKKGSDWRAPLDANNAQQQQNLEKLKKRKKQFALGLQRHKTTATAAPDAQFLDLLQYRGTGSNSRKSNHHKHRNNKSNKLPVRQPCKTPRHGVETVPMTLADGTRVYLKKRHSSNNNNTVRTSTSTTTAKQQQSCTLGVTMKDLLRRVDSIKRRQIHLKNRFHHGSGSDSKQNSSLDSTLWVDKHAPSSFPQLLSEERTNREVLRALRGWDPYVFGKAKMPERKSMSMYNNNGNNGNSNGNGNNGDGDSKQGNQNYNNNSSFKPTTTKSKESNNNFDAVPTNPNDKRPVENARVILLSGPPGV